MSGGLKDDSGKLRYGLAPKWAERERIAVLTYGAIKYEPNNWRAVDEWRQRYTDAYGRHLAAYEMGALLDEDTRLMHLAHASCCLDFLSELEMTTNQDRLVQTFDARYLHALEHARKVRAARLASGDRAAAQ